MPKSSNSASVALNHQFAVVAVYDGSVCFQLQTKPTTSKAIIKSCSDWNNHLHLKYVKREICEGQTNEKMKDCLKIAFLSFIKFIIGLLET